MEKKKIKKTMFKSLRGDVVQIITNNYCNLHCEWCSLLCHIPFNATPHRKRWNMSKSDAELFCERFEGYYTSSIHKLLGGETTAMPLKTLYSIVDVFYKHGRKLKLLTNGFNLFGIKKKYLNKIKEIELNNHGINEKHVYQCARYLSRHFDGEVIIRKQQRHYDLGEARKHCTVGFPCESIMNPPVLYQGVMYPCCIHPGMEMWDGDLKTRTALIQDGWGLNNPDVAEVLVKWRVNLPDHVLKQCSYNCWVPRRLNINIETFPITLKKNDVIQKIST